IAQQCEVNGKSSTRLVKNSDGANNFIDILAEDPEYFPLRKLSVLPVGTSSDRAVVRGLQNMLMSDNTIQKDFSDLVDIFTNPYALRLKQIAEQMRKKSEANLQEDREFQEKQLDKQIEANKQQLAEERQHELVAIDLKGQWQLKGDYLVALGRDSASTTTDDFDQITKAYQTSLKEKSLDADIDFKGRELTRKMNLDAESRKLEAEKLKLKAQEIQVRREDIANKKFISVINKN
ncbi:MAG TPA: hypothetical protein VLE02_04985, partial [Nitrosarchaeum sp.]|nr:hypothetical protein [Nitrosarchaeum sp.]